MSLKIAVSSGKGGTGKTFISTNLAYIFNNTGKKTVYIDCDVEEPNGHLFLKPQITKIKKSSILSPIGIDHEKCNSCGKCAEVCHYNAITVVKDKVLFFKNMCHTCGACKIICPQDAIIEKEREIGEIKEGQSGSLKTSYGYLETGEGGMSPRLIRKVKRSASEEADIIIYDSPPGTACAVVETVKDADLVLLVTDPTPFGIHDLKLSVDMCRKIGKEPVVLINRADYKDESLHNYLKKAGLDTIDEIPDDRAAAFHYSNGDIVAEKSGEYNFLFSNIAKKILKYNMNRSVKPPIDEPEIFVKERLQTERQEKNLLSPGKNQKNVNNREIFETVVISGKGGTGKTSLTAALCALEKPLIVCDCDVDAADLHLILEPRLKEQGTFSGSLEANINQNICSSCGLCYKHCRFEAVKKKQIENETNHFIYTIDTTACEGCGVCHLVCPQNAVNVKPAVNGKWYVSNTRMGPMSHARLGIAEENSGKLVTLVRNRKDLLSQETGYKNVFIDGSPGTGCPVISSLTGAGYACVVTEPTVSGVHDLKRILDLVKYFQIPGGVVVNKYDLNDEKTSEIKKMTESYEMAFLGVIRYDKNFNTSQMHHKAIIEYTEKGASEDIKNIYKNLKHSQKTLKS